MPKRADTLDTLMLSLELLHHIPRSRKATASELYEQIKNAGFDRELRTIQRLLDRISEHFSDYIERDERSKPYGYRWVAKSQALAIPGLTPQESLLLGLAEEHLRNLLPARLMDSMKDFFDQARRNLGPDSNAKLERQWSKKVRVAATSQPLLPPRIASGVFDAVSEALYANHWLQLDYTNAEGKRATREVMPLGLVQQGPALYLVCRFKGYDNERNLALHRVHSAHVSTIEFQRPKDFDLKKYDEDGRFGFGEGQRIKLSFQIDGKIGYHLQEQRLSEDQQVVELPDGRLKITATVVDSEMLAWWLRGFGEAVSRVEKISL
jgi:predicted DNA-binding transcriptional regulator YafY